MQQGQKDSEIKLFYRAAASPLLALQSASHRSKNAEKLTQRRRFQPQGKRSWKSKVIRAWLKSIPQKVWLFAKPGWGDGGHHGPNSLFEEKYVFFFRDHAGWMGVDFLECVPLPEHWIPFNTYCSHIICLTVASLWDSAAARIVWLVSAGWLPRQPGFAALQKRCCPDRKEFSRGTSSLKIQSHA